MDGMNVSLDDLIKSKQKDRRQNPTKGKGGKEAFKGKANSGNQRNGRKSAPYKETPKVVKHNSDVVIRQPTASTASIATGLSIFERIGTKPPLEAPIPAVSGTFVTISNLNTNITIADLSELCQTIGDIKRVEFTGRTSNGKLEAMILFSRRSDAETCVKNFHDLTFDGTPMRVKLTGSNGKENPFNPHFQTVAAKGPKNSKASFLGTALADDDEDESGGGPRFSVTLSKPPSDSFHRIDRNSGRGMKPASRDQKSVARNKNKSVREKSGPASVEDLDAQLDNYKSGLTGTAAVSSAASAGKGKKGGRGQKALPSSEDLDADLDKYMQGGN